MPDISIGTVFRTGRVLYDKIRSGESWYENHVAEPLLQEVEEAKHGSFPGEYGSRSSRWETAVSAPARRKSHKHIREAAKKYTQKLSEIENLEQKRIGIAEHFIESLPGGEISGSDVLVYTYVTSVDDSVGPAEPRPEKGDFDSWLLNVWPGFEESENVDDLRRNLEALAARPENSLDPNVFLAWEDQIGEPEWANSLWSAYKDEYLPRYRRTVEDLQDARDWAKQHANEVDSQIEARI